MRIMLAVVRLVVLAAVMPIGSVVVLACGLTGVRIRGVRLASWVVVGLARVMCRIFRVRVVCATPERLAAPAGLIFPNHLSLLDPVVLLAVAPMRFVAAVEVQRYPVLGWLATGIDTVFVRRSDPDARKAARGEIAHALRGDPALPVVLFPEGRLGPGDALYPLRYGAFAVAASDAIPYVLCGLRYSPVEVVIWRGGLGETLGSALWRLACHAGPVRVEVLPLPALTPPREDDPVQMATAAQTALAHVLGLPAEPAVPPPPRMA